MAPTKNHRPPSTYLMYGALVIKTDFNTKVTEIENKMPSTNDLVTNTKRSRKAIWIQNKKPNTSRLVKKTDYNTTILEDEN